MRQLVAITLLATAFLGNASAEDFPHAVVAADHPLASAAGAEVLRGGGNVVDAAVATSFALSVVRPYSCGLGGGGFMVIWNAESQRATVLDYRERAPLAATRDMYAGADVPAAERTLLSREGGLAAAVPGEVAGLCAAQARFGRLELAAVLAPAIRLARDGWPLGEHHAATLRSVIRTFEARPEMQQRFPVLWNEYLYAGRLPDVGTTIRSPQLPALEAIRDRGAAGFYEGEVAASLLRTVREAGGIWSPEDLVDVAPVTRKPLRASVGGVALLTMPPPSSGGIALIQTLYALDEWDRTHPERSLVKLGHNTPGYAHVVTEAMKHAFADRAEYLGDADFVEVPIARLTSEKYGRRIAGRIDFDRTLPTTEYGRFAPVEDAGTSHLSVVDAAGNAVACTETINTLFGSYVVDPRFGIVLNDEMDDFTAIPGEKNAFGLVQSAANAVAPRKKPLSSMSPTIAVRDGRAVLAVGASGGPRIISSTLQVLLNVTRFELPVERAVALPRFHHQWLPDELLVEPPLAERLAADLRERGHSVVSRSELAVTQLAVRTQNGVAGASDPRKHGRPAGH
jgi:gamma-glutamyltranspeptidase / glutathione hydrolase